VVNFVIESVDVPFDGGPQFFGVTPARDAAEGDGDEYRHHHPHGYAYQQPGHVTLSSTCVCEIAVKRWFGFVAIRNWSCTVRQFGQIERTVPQRMWRFRAANGFSV
jgi:hypothetical protein